MTQDSSTLTVRRLADGEFLIVGIGASAGGVEALESMFESMPEKPGFAIIVVQHLSPNFESLMPQIISRRTDMTVSSAVHGASILPNHIHVLPAGKELSVAGGKIELRDRAPGSQVSKTINRFFTSLAEDFGQRSVAVVLSGTGNDGADGIKEVHEKGGFVIVQSEDSAKFNGMPRAALDSGIADAVVSADNIPDVLARLHETLHGEDTEDDVLSEIEMGATKILQMLRKRYQIDFSQYKSAMFNRRLHRRLMLDDNRLQGIGGYLERVQEDAQELDQLFSDLLIGVTQFFRDPEAFDVLRKEILPELLEKCSDNGTIRVWVAPTATGEEAYSIAMMIDELMQEMKVNLEVKIFATDAHRQSIEIASRGVYPPERLTNVSEARKKQYFRKNEDGYHVCRHIRKMIVFAEHNLLSDAPFTGLDMICCRNLLIYMKPTAQQRILSLCNFGLNSNGVLFLGPSETVSDLRHEFTTINEKWRFFSKSDNVRPLSMNLSMSSAPKPLIETKQRSSLPAAGVLDSYDQLIDDFIPPSLLVTKDHQIVHVFSGASRFLSIPEGRPTADVLQMLPDALRIAVANGIRRCSADQQSCVFGGLTCEVAGKVGHYRVTVKSIRNRRIRRTDFLVSFLDTEKAAGSEVVDEIDSGSASMERVNTLEEELRDTRESLHASIQELKSANEEMQSTNEELIASNEELQSTNEELHSVNEELYTVNSEHQRKISELTELTDDMENLLDSIRVDTIFLDRHLNLRKFTLGIARTFRLIPQDVGRRIDAFNHDLRHDALIDDIQSVLDSEKPLEKEVQDLTGSWYLMRLLPYTSRGRVDGVLLTLIDISPMKRAEQKLAELSEIVEVSEDAIFKVDTERRIRTWNRGAETLYGYKPDEVIGNEFQMLAADTEDHAVLSKSVGEPDRTDPLQHINMVHVRKDGQQIDVAITISPITGLERESSGASVVIRDISTQKRAQEEVQEAVKRRDEFLAMLSHELRNPLAAIRNANSILREDQIDAETAAEAREVAQTQLQHLTTLLDDLLDVARVTNDKLLLKLEVVDLQKSMLEATECVQHQIDEKDQRLFVDTPSEPLRILGDIGRLQQAQVNLLVNACKYTQQGGEIRFLLKREGDEAVLSVIDDGIGVSEELAKSIFELFVQSEQALDRSQGGMGLGLPLVRMIVTAHGGSISLKRRENDSETGSVFEMRFPLTSQTPTLSVLPSPIPLLDKRLLLIEDNDGIRRMLARSLELKGLEVATARDGQEGIEMLTELRPDIAVVDIGLPDINGYEVARQTRLIPEMSDVLMVAVTGYGRAEDQQKAMAAGFDAHIVKPVDPSDLITKLAELSFVKLGNTED
jgi:two-component system CheB/CheR fusion protein